MIFRQGATACLGIVALSLLNGCAGGLLGGGKPDSLYRFGMSGTVPRAMWTPAQQQTIVLERVRFATEVDGDRMLAVHAGSARYIKGSRWVTTGPSLFTQAILGSFQSRAPGFRITTTQGGEVTGYSLVVSIGRFEAQYDDIAMTHPPMVAVEGDVSLYRLADRNIVAQLHFAAHVRAEQNRVEEIVGAFDRATTCYTADVADWATASAANQAPPTSPSCTAIR